MLIDDVKMLPIILKMNLKQNKLRAGKGCTALLQLVTKNVLLFKIFVAEDKT